MDCILQLRGPQASGWAWPMEALTGDQKEGEDGGQGAVVLQLQDFLVVNTTVLMTKSEL